MANPVIWEEGQTPPPVSPAHPLVGLEAHVLQSWLENSPHLKQAYQSNPQHRASLDNLARARVEEARGLELRLRGQGVSLEHAQEQSRPAMWTVPTLPPPTT